MNQSAWYQDWFNSPYYHLLYQHRDEQEAAEFIDRLMGYLHPREGSRMLDVACGKGRHAVQLARYGFEVTGIDLSEESIAFAKKTETPNLQFFRHDMRQPFYINYFHYAFNFFTSFGYFDTRHEHAAAIRTVADALQPGGIFVLDYLNAGRSGNAPVSTQEETIGGVTYRIDKWSDSDHLYKRIEVLESAKGVRQEFTEKVARFSLAEFEAFFSAKRLRITEIFGDYSFSAFDLLHSPRLIIMAVKE